MPRSALATNPGRNHTHVQRNPVSLTAADTADAVRVRREGIGSADPWPQGETLVLGLAWIPMRGSGPNKLRAPAAHQPRFSWSSLLVGRRAIAGLMNRVPRSQMRLCPSGRVYFLRVFAHVFGRAVPGNLVEVCLSVQPNGYQHSLCFPLFSAGFPCPMLGPRAPRGNPG
jgi:hypothetical protein